MAVNPFESPFAAAASGALGGYNAGINTLRSIKQMQAEMAMKQAIARLVYQGKVDPASIRANTQKSLFTGDGLTDPNGNPVQGSGVTREQQVQGGVFNAGQRNALTGARLLGMGQANPADFTATGVAAAGTPGGGLYNFQNYGTLTPGRPETGYTTQPAPPPAPPAAPDAPPQSAAPPAGVLPPVGAGYGAPPATSPAVPPSTVSTGPPTNVYGNGITPLVAGLGKASILNKIAGTNLINNGRTPLLQAQTTLTNDKDTGQGYTNSTLYQGSLDKKGMDAATVARNNSQAQLNTVTANSIPGKTAAQIAEERAAALHSTVAAQMLPKQVAIQGQVANNGTANATTNAGRLGVEKQGLALRQTAANGGTPTQLIAQQQKIIHDNNATKNALIERTTAKGTDGTVHQRALTASEQDLVNRADYNIQQAQVTLGRMNTVAPMPVRSAGTAIVPATGRRVPVPSAPTLPRTFNYKGRALSYTVTK